jgi:hypothetical protein
MVLRYSFLPSFSSARDLGPLCISGEQVIFVAIQHQKESIRQCVCSLCGAEKVEPSSMQDPLSRALYKVVGGNENVPKWNF